MVSVFTNPLSTERKEPASRRYEFIIIDTRNKLNHVTESHCKKNCYIDTLKAMISFFSKLTRLCLLRLIDKHRFFFFQIDESRPFTIDAMLNNNHGKNLNKENSQQRGMKDRDY
jgi:hypothetical protein